jgi:hypothetical protein
MTIITRKEESLAKKGYKDAIVKTKKVPQQHSKLGS